MPLDFFRPTEDGTLRGTLESDIAFESGSAVLSSPAKTILQQAALDLHAYDGHICIEGFADGVGGEAYNLQLSKMRAVAVLDFFEVEELPNAMGAIGHGEEFAPDDQNDPAWRRVDITLTACGE
ncbi:MAG: OmpA family protein [Sulfitobacter sp.]|nr:OmpA family protein [Sulfitobacter sp.]